MKKALLCLITLLILVLPACTKTFDGYYRDIALARDEIECYQENDYVFTAKANDVNVDFVICGEAIHIVEFLVKNGDESPQYKVKTFSSFLIKEQISLNDHDWNTSSELSEASYKWCIVPKEFHKVNEDFDTFEFSYQDKMYCLYYEFFEKAE